jgi:hypothetical protein
MTVVASAATVNLLRLFCQPLLRYFDIGLETIAHIWGAVSESASQPLRDDVA